MSSEQTTTSSNTITGTSTENTVNQTRHSEKKTIDQDKKGQQFKNWKKKPATSDGNDNENTVTITTTNSNKKKNNYYKNKKKQNGTVNKDNKTEDENKKKEPSEKGEEEEEEGEYCFICTEPIVTYAVTPCNHRTCHLCTLRLRALYQNKNCVYCKTEQKSVIFTKDATKLYEEFIDKDICYVDKKLDIRFESELIHQDIKLLLQYNCPDPKCDISCSGWGELKKHANNDHNLQLCDLCIKNKKIFAHEHTLYTYSQLHKHMKFGDKALNKEDSGFDGHPECHFCRKRFYGNDELFLHCREKHEQCHICVRNGVRHEYFPDYNGLEKHFRNDHYLCMYRECLDQKFIVFESELDLKSHEVDVHGASGRVDLGFEYGYRSGASSTSQRQKNKQPQQSHSSTTTSTANETLISHTDFPSINNNNNNNNNTERTIPGQPKKQKGKQQQQQQQRLQKPKGFGGLSAAENWPDLNQSSSSNATTGSSNTDNNVDEAALQQHADFLRKVASLLNGPQGVEQFRSLTTAYRNNTMDSSAYVKEIYKLCDNDSSKASTILKGVEELMDKDNKKKEILTTWRNTRATNEESFPALTSTSGRSVGHASSKRVLVIKEGSTRVGGTRTTSKSRAGVWDRVANAANSTSSSANRSNSGNNSNNGSPSSSRPSSPMHFPTPQMNKNKTAWAGTTNNNTSSKKDSKEDFPSITQHFPSLPAVKQTHPTILNMRRNVNGSSSAWSPSSSYDNNNNIIDEDSIPIQDKKKKGKKGKQVLFRVGL
ncbi:unnamed protein product [Cunninghamella blakesleeana]